MKRKEVRKMMWKSTQITVLILTMILGLISVPVTACEDLVNEVIRQTVFDPTDNIYFRQTT